MISGDTGVKAEIVKPPVSKTKSSNPRSRSSVKKRKAIEIPDDDLFEGMSLDEIVKRMNTFTQMVSHNLSLPSLSNQDP